MNPGTLFSVDVGSTHWWLDKSIIFCITCAPFNTQVIHYDPDSVFLIEDMSYYKNITCISVQCEPSA